MGMNIWQWQDRKEKLTADEMKITRRTVKATWTNHTWNEDTSEELKAKPVLDKLQKYNTNAFKYIDRMQRNITNYMNLATMEDRTKEARTGVEWLDSFPAIW